MKYQAKVKQTEKYSDSQGEHAVCRGKLILLKGGLDKPNRLIINGEFYNPIIISETEEIKYQDKVLYKNNIHVVVTTDVYNIKLENDKVVNRNDVYKILALPEHFSDKHLQAIVDGKIKDGDEVLVKCELYDNTNFEQDLFRVYFGHNQKITLFPVKQSLEEAAKEYYYGVQPRTDEEFIQMFKDAAEWAKKNKY